jgi:general secretion pathway protein A
MYYESYFELKEAPFSISPDPRYLYLTQNHREALALLLYGVSSNGGFVLLTGEIGTGKTTVCQCLLEQLPENTEVAYILNSKLEPREFFAAICDDLGILYPSGQTGLKRYIDLIHEHLLASHAKGRNTVLMVDEAQNLSTELLEHLRLLTNLETCEKKLLQIMLVGQPELRDKIALPEMEQMAQRITARFHLGPLSKKEVAIYVRHRLKVAGAKHELFTQGSLKLLWKFTGGVPRRINIICDRALLGTSISKREKVNHLILEKAAQEVLGRKVYFSKLAGNYWVWGGVALLVMGVAFSAAYHVRNDQTLKTLSIAGLGSLEQLSPVALHKKAKFKETAQEVQSVEPVEPRVSPQEPVAMKPRASPVNTLPVVDALEMTSDSVDDQAQTKLLFPNDLSLEVLELSAFSALFRRWGLNYLPELGVDPCQFASTVGLGCLKGQGNLPILQLLNRPALVTLYDQQGRGYPTLFLGISGNGRDIVLALGGEVQRIPITSLANWWYGDYLVLWHIPRGYQFPLKAGDSSGAVVWLWQQLGETIGRTGENTVNQTYTKELESTVKLFQRSHSLVPDGAVGPRTIIALNNQSDVKFPKFSMPVME